MIKLQDGELLDLLPSPQLKKDTDMICLSYALKVVMDEFRNTSSMCWPWSSGARTTVRTWRSR